jgi:hypothetical protein
MQAWAVSTVNTLLKYGRASKSDFISDIITRAAFDEAGWEHINARLVKAVATRQK